ncbi:MAG: hypothetical protein ED557_13460 [Balneola sp.]|nr:MAG: hypothetical protein ED557_13460 [Balneola sp.]
MKKGIIKITGMLCLIAIITVNITSTFQISLGGEEVRASDPDKIPCYSAYSHSTGHTLVFCLGCTEKKGQHSGTAGECTPEDLGEN